MKQYLASAFKGTQRMNNTPDWMYGLLSAQAELQGSTCSWSRLTTAKLVAEIPTRFSNYRPNKILFSTLWRILSDCTDWRHDLDIHRRVASSLKIHRGISTIWKISTCPLWRLFKNFTHRSCRNKSMDCSENKMQPYILLLWKVGTSRAQEFAGIIFS